MNNKTCYIFGAGDLNTEIVEIHDNAFIICADAGLNHAERLNINPDVIIGDFDSRSKPEKYKDAEIIVYPSKKDFTDMHLSVKYAYDLGFRNFEIYGAFGGKRIDHSFANVQMLKHFTKLGCTIKLYSESMCVTALFAENDKRSIKFDSGHKGYISVFALTEMATGVTISYLKYTLENATVSSDFPLGVSNEFIGKDAEISILNGGLIIIYEI